MTTVTILFEDLKKAHARLKEALQLPYSEINQDASIQRFEFTFELTWKLLNRIEREQGIETYSPRSTFREATKTGLIDDPALWFKFLEARNLTSHTYNQEIAKKVYSSAREFSNNLDRLLPKIQAYLQSEK